MGAISSCISHSGKYPYRKTLGMIFLISNRQECPVSTIIIHSYAACITLPHLTSHCQSKNNLNSSKMYSTGTFPFDTHCPYQTWDQVKLIFSVCYPYETLLKHPWNDINSRKCQVINIINIKEDISFAPKILKIPHLSISETRAQNLRNMFIGHWENATLL